MVSFSPCNHFRIQNPNPYTKLNFIFISIFLSVCWIWFFFFFLYFFSLFLSSSSHKNSICCVVCNTVCIYLKSSLSKLTFGYRFNGISYIQHECEIGAFVTFNLQFNTLFGVYFFIFRSIKFYEAHADCRFKLAWLSLIVSFRQIYFTCGGHRHWTLSIIQRIQHF